MPDAFDRIDRHSLTERPDEPAVGYQSWHDLLFVHWRISPFELEPLLPKELTLDLYDGSAWLGLIPFRMSGVRPRWFPAVPGISSFYETNLRTYVHCRGENPGIWFFSLDASSSLAVEIARQRWWLPYHRATMEIERTENWVRYFSRRLGLGEDEVGATVRATIGDLIGALDKNVPAGQAIPGTLEYFLAERYLFYCQSPDGTLYHGRVHHRPYSLREADVLDIEESLTTAAHAEVRTEPVHALYSDGVDVEVFKPQRSRDQRDFGH